MSETKKEKCLALKVLCSKWFIITVTVLLGLVVGLTVLGIDTQSKLKAGLLPFLDGPIVSGIYNALGINRLPLGKGFVYLIFTLVILMYIFVIGSIFVKAFVNKTVGNKGDEFKSQKAAKGFMYFFFYLLLAFGALFIIFIISACGKYSVIGTNKTQATTSLLKIIGLYIAFVAVVFGIIVLIKYIVNKKKAKKGEGATEEVKEEPVEEIKEEPATEEVKEEVKEEPVAEEVKEEVKEEPVEEPAEEKEEEQEDAVVADNSVIVGDVEGQEIERLSRSFMGKLCQARHEVKDAYDDIRAQLLSFKKVNSRLSWSSENFNLGRRKVAKMDVRGKAIILYLALDPATVDAKYHAKDKSQVKRFAETPTMVRVRSDRGLKFAIELIDEMLEDVEKKDNYVPEKVAHTLKTDKELLELGLAKRVKSKF